MEFKAEIKKTFTGPDKLRAVCSVVLDDCFLVKNVRVVEGEKGLFVSLPSRRNVKGRFSHFLHPATILFSQLAGTIQLPQRKTGSAKDVDAAAASKKATQRSRTTTKIRAITMALPSASTPKTSMASATAMASRSNPATIRSPVSISFRPRAFTRRARFCYAFASKTCTFWSALATRPPQWVSLTLPCAATTAALSRIAA